MKAIFVDDINESTEPGSVELRHIPGVTKGMAFRCPGCGEQSWVWFNVYDNKNGWDLEVEEPLTLNPSLLHDKDSGGCGWHGFMRKGEFVGC